MDVSLVPAITTPAQTPPAQAGSRGTPSGEVPFGSALTSALRETAQADGPAAGSREPQGAARSGSAIGASEPPPDEPEDSALAGEDPSVGVPSDVFAHFGIPCPVPFDVPPLAVEPAPEAALAVTVKSDHSGALSLASVMPVPATVEAPGTPSPAGGSGDASLVTDGKPTPTAPQPPAAGMAGWTSTRSVGPSNAPSAVANSRQASPGQAAAGARQAAADAAPPPTGTTETLPFVTPRMGDTVRRGEQAPDGVGLRPTAEYGISRRPDGVAGVPRQEVPAPQHGRQAAAVEVLLAPASTPPGPADVPSGANVAVARGGQTESAALSSAVQQVLQGDDTILAFPDGQPAQIDANLDVEAIARAAVGSNNSGDRQNRSRDEDGPGERAQTKHAAASAVAAYAVTMRTGAPEPLLLAPDPVSSPAQAEDASKPTANGEPLEHAIVKSLKLQWSQGAGEARLQLKPEYLGELSIALKVQGTVVTAVLQSDSAAVRTWVEEHQGELRRALEDIGLSLDRLVVDADGESNQQQRSTPEERRHSQPRRNTPSGRFEALL